MFKGGTRLQGIDHIGIAVHSIEKSLPFYTEVLKFTYIKSETVEKQGVKVAFIDAHNCKIELLEPINQHSPVYRFLQKRGEGIHHIALKTDQIQEKIEQLQNGGIRMIDTEPKKGANGADIAFLHPSSTFGVLWELCHKKDS